MALTGGEPVPTFLATTQVMRGKNSDKSLGPRSSFGCGEWCPLSFGFGLVTEDHHRTGVSLVVIFGSESHTQTCSGIRTLAPRYYRKSMLLLCRCHFLDVCRHFRTCCACTCKDYVCMHSQPKWLCHFGSSLILCLRNLLKTHPPTPE